MKRGFSTGANDFFYLTKDDVEKWKLEKEFITPLIRSARKLSKTRINDVEDHFLFFCNKDKKSLKGTNALKYIKWAEEQGFHERPTCKGRRPWYALGDRKPGELLAQKLPFTKWIFAQNLAKAYPTCNIYEIWLDKREYSEVVSAFLNSTLNILLFESTIRQALGGGAGAIMAYELRESFTIDPSKISKKVRRSLEKAFVKLSHRKIGSIFEEIGAKTSKDVSIEKIKLDRRELDKIVFDILGLSNEERLGVYKAVVDLVRARIERAKSVTKRKKKVKGMDVDALVQDIFEEVGKGKLMKFPDDYIEDLDCREITVPEGEAEVGQDLYGFYVKIDGKEIRCKSPYEARYVQYAVLNGKTTIRIFKDEKLIREAVREYSSLLREATKRINEYLESTIPDRKLRKRIKDDVWKKLIGKK